MIYLARELRAVEHRGQALGLTEEEMAFYDAVAKGQEHIAGDEQLKTIARELVTAIKKNLSIDWTDHENVKAKIRATVKRLLYRYGYKPAECETLVVVIMDYGAGGEPLPRLAGGGVGFRKAGDRGW